MRRTKPTKLQSRYQPGDKIGGRYQVYQVLMGGMGEVYLCLDLKENLPLALKTFQQRYLRNPKIRDAFNTEVATWLALGTHPNIVRCFYMDDTLDDQPFMILEWITSNEKRGTDLRSWLLDGPLDLQLALEFTIDICRGLIHAGQKQPGLVHQDLKPDNILIAQGRLAKITDFGLARIVQQAGLETVETEYHLAERQSLLGHDGIVGTPAYMAPEQWRGEELDVRTDLYAIGCILYEMLANKRPYHAVTKSGLRRLHLEGDIPKLADQLSAYSIFDPVLDRCLAKQRNERFSTPDMLLAELAGVYEKKFDLLPRKLATSTHFTALDYYNRGLTYAKLQRNDEALADFDQAIALDPDYAQPYAERGLIYNKLKQFTKAFSDYDKAIDLDPAYEPAYFNRGTLYSRLHRNEEALADLTKALSLDPNDPVTFYQRGLVYAALQRFSLAVDDFSQAIKLDPKYVEAYGDRGRLNVQLERYDEAFEDCTQAIELDHEYAQAYAFRGVVYAKRKMYDEALVDYTNAIKLDPTNAETLYNRGVAYDTLRRYEEALADYTQSIRLDPEWAIVYHNRGFIYRDLHRYEESIADCNSAIGLEPDFAAAYVNRGLTYERMQLYAEAITDYDRALELNPANGLAQLKKRQLLAFRKDIDESRDTRKSQTQVHETDDVKQNVRLQLLDVASLVNQGKFDEAEKTIDIALNHTPNDPEVLEVKGELLAATGRMAEAESYFDRALSIDRKYQPAAVNKAICLIHRKDFHQALSFLDEVISWQPDLVMAWINRGTCLKQMGRYNDAVSSYVQGSICAGKDTEEKNMAFGHALVCARKAIKLNRAQNDLEGEAQLLESLGNLCFDQAEYAGGFACYIQALGCLKNCNSNRYRAVYDGLFSMYGRLSKLDPDLPGNEVIKTRKLVESLKNDGFGATTATGMAGYQLAQSLLTRGYKGMSPTMQLLLETTPRFSQSELQDVWIEILG